MPPKPVTNHAPRTKENQRRLALHTTIGLFMAAIAVAGYLLLGPTSEIATGEHARPADVATSVSSPVSVLSATLPMTAADLAVMQAEMEILSARADALLEDEAQPAPAATGRPATLPLLQSYGE